MPTLVCLGFGYCAEHYAIAHGARFDRIVGTAQTADKVAALTHRAFADRGIEALTFDGKAVSQVLHEAVSEADALLVSIPPDEAGDPALAALGDTLAQAARLRSIVYLSTVGVYGDHGGAWVDESTQPTPGQPRSRERLNAERAWQALGARHSCAVAVLRLAGIYGPGQNALVQVARGTARRIVKPGQVFNRIHVADVARAIDAAFARRADGVFNLADDEPTPPGDPIVFAAELLGVAPPPEIPFEEARKSMTEMAASFYAENRRVKNEKLKTALGVVVAYPTYREGLTALRTSATSADGHPQSISDATSHVRPSRE
jgi:nucleoside-diphosphate-sugar epimerase